ncbi:MAG: magnesium transporter [Acidimicrobiaceae bacterium]|nr:magnesium transporter [Acidimicrobiaceae bacterium]MDQ1412031.1 magnesium transporter [Acidimicrobiaceae bacterium]
MTEALTRKYRKGVLDSENFPVSEISECLEEPGTLVWVDLCGPSVDQLHELAAELGLHELAVEDALGEHQRPKLDRYGTHLFLSCHSVQVDVETGTLHETEIDAFINPRWLITVRKNEGFPIKPVLERWDRSANLITHGVSFLVYGLLDVVVDGYFEAVEAFDEYYEDVSEGLFNDELLTPMEQRHWFDMRRAMVRFHRLVVPMREAVSSLMRREHSVVPEDFYPYFQDVYDHILRVSESTDSLRDLVGTIVETNISLRDYRQNLIVKKVSSWAAIIAVPALITGFYGMNVPFPGFGKHWGAFASATFIVLACAALYALFRRRDWL